MEEVISKFSGKLTLTEAEQEEVLDVKTQDFKSLQTTLDLSLVGKLHFHSTNYFNINSFKNTMTRLWRPRGELKIREIDDNRLFLFVFPNMEDKLRVLENGPWNFGTSIVVVDNPVGTINPSAMKLCHVAFWVQVHGLPLLCRNLVVASKIANCLGKGVEVDKGQEGDLWGKYMRIKVKLDVTKPLKRGMKISVEGHKPCWVDFKYEGLPVVCHRCGIMGHKKNDCPNEE